jgi:glycosyltransferase involved in cell wall biosynthesis
MRILIVSWAHEAVSRNGISLCTKQHYKLLKDMGHQVAVVYPHIKINSYNDVSGEAYFIGASGSPALFSKRFFDTKAATQLLQSFKPDIVLCESWQNSMSENFINLCYKLEIKTAVLSHGISIHPFTFSPKNLLRSLRWSLYWLRFHSVVKKIHAITCLSFENKSNRFYDAKIAVELGKKVVYLTNTPINYSGNYVQYEMRNRNILIIGYFSDIKNQYKALKIAKQLQEENFNFIFIGNKVGRYFNKCLNFASHHELKNVQFLTDQECSIANEISRCFGVISTSSTEVLPLTLLEAMASGTPFISTNVGAICELPGGILCSSVGSFVTELKNLSVDIVRWQALSVAGRLAIDTKYSEKVVKKQLDLLLNSLVE